MRALLIAIRYASCRRQFKTIQGSKNERKVIDYQTWQANITPLLAKTIGYIFVSHHVREEFRKMYDEVQQGEFGRLDVMHHILAGLKALISEEGIFIIDLARRSAGGAGYLSGAGFTEIMEQASPVPTFEGDNTVMLLQSARYVFKLVKKVQKGQQSPFPFGYLSRVKELTAIKGRGKSVEELMDINLLMSAVAIRALVLIGETVKAIEESPEHAKVKDNELFSRMKIDMVRAHNENTCLTIVKHSFETRPMKDPRIRLLLQDLLRIQALTLLDKGAGAIYQSGFFAPEANKFIKLALDKLIAKVRP